MFQKINVHTLHEKLLIDVSQGDQSSRSLLNRNAIGEYKFSHRSILEYFLALEALDNIEFRRKFQFDTNLDTARSFFKEMLQYENRLNEFSYEELNRLKLPELAEVDHVVIQNKTSKYGEELKKFLLHMTNLRMVYNIIVYISMVIFIVGAIIKTFGEVRSGGILHSKLMISLIFMALFALIFAGFILFNRSKSYIKIRNEIDNL